MGQVIDLARYRSEKAVDTAIQGIRQKNMDLFIQGMDQLGRDADALGAEADRIHNKRKEQEGVER